VNEMPSLDNEKCDGCQLCVGVCRCGGLVTADKSVRVVHVANCDGCGECELVCPTGAISFSFEVVIEGPQD